jgi:hypothetical protein
MAFKARAEKRTFDRLNGGFQKPGNPQSSGPTIHVDAHLDWLEKRIVNLAGHRAVDLKHDLPRLRAFALQNGCECSTLLGARALVDDGLHLAVPLVNGPGQA